MLKTAYFCTILLLSGCGTIQSMQSPDDLRRDMRARKSHCSFLPQLYSGVAYNFCVLNAGQSNPKKPDLGLDFLIIDTGLSLIADTGLIPYTLYEQLVRKNTSID